MREKAICRILLIIFYNLSCTTKRTLFPISGTVCSWNRNFLVHIRCKKRRETRQKGWCRYFCPDHCCIYQFRFHRLNFHNLSSCILHQRMLQLIACKRPKSVCAYSYFTQKYDNGVHFLKSYLSIFFQHFADDVNERQLCSWRFLIFI